MIRIDQMFAFVAEDVANGLEGVVGWRFPNGEWMPLVGADMARVDALRPIAKEIAAASGSKIRLLKFTTRTELEVIDGKNETTQ